MYDDARYTIYNIVEQQKIMNKLEQGREYREYWGLRNKNNGKGENSTYDEGCEGDIPDDIGIPCTTVWPARIPKLKSKLDAKYNSGVKRMEDGARSFKSRLYYTKPVIGEKSPILCKKSLEDDSKSRKRTNDSKNSDGMNDERGFNFGIFDSTSLNRTGEIHYKRKEDEQGIENLSKVLPIPFEEDELEGGCENLNLQGEADQCLYTPVCFHDNKHTKIQVDIRGTTSRLPRLSSVSRSGTNSLHKPLLKYTNGDKRFQNIENNGNLKGILIKNSKGILGEAFLPPTSFKNRCFEKTDSFLNSISPTPQTKKIVRFAKNNFITHYDDF